MDAGGYASRSTRRRHPVPPGPRAKGLSTLPYAKAPRHSEKGILASKNPWPSTWTPLAGLVDDNPLETGSCQSFPLDSPLPAQPPRPHRAAGDASDPKAFGAWSYNPDGSVASETRGAGAVTRSFNYDGLGRPVRVNEPAATLDVSYRKGGAFDAGTPCADGKIAAERITYNPAAFPAGTAPPGSTTSYAYDSYGRLRTATSDRPALNVMASYDGDGNLTSLTQAGATQTYAY